MTTRGHRRSGPMLIGLATGAVVATLAMVLGPVRQPSDAAVGQPEGAAAVGQPADATPSQPPAAATPPLLRAPPTAPAPRPPAPNRRGGSLQPLTVAAPPLLPLLPPLLLSPTPPPRAAPPPAPRARPPALPRPLLSGPAGQIVALTNAARARAGCPPLRVDRRLVDAAQGHSADMASNQYFAHDSPDGSDFVDRDHAAGYPRPGGENIARGQPTPAEVMADWMSSPGHRRNILNCEFTTIGVGYVAAGRFWTQNFGR